MLEILHRATLASQQGHWSKVNQYLQQLPTRNNRKGQLQLDRKEAQQVLQLALGVLNWGDFQERWEVAKFFPKMGEIAIAPLIEILEDEEANWEERWFAARILGGFDCPMAISALVEVLKNSDDEELTAMAASVLANFGQSAVEALTALLANPELRGLATRSLSQIRRPATIEPLLAIAEDVDVSVRATAIEALSSFRDPRILPLLIHALRDRAAVVRKEAAIGLGLRSDVQQEWNLVKNLKPLLWDLNGEVCTAAAIALGRMGTPEAAAVLFEVLQSPMTPLSLQLDIVRALTWVETAPNLDYLQRAIPLVSSLCVEEIVKLLGRIKSPGLQPRAAQVLRDCFGTGQGKTIRLKQALAQAWGHLKHQDAIAILSELLADPEETVRLHAIAALKHFPEVALQR